MENTKFGFKEVFKPTPSNMVKLGNALMATAAFVSVTFAFLLEDKTIAISFMAVGAIGKFISMMFTDVPAPAETVAEPVQDKVIMVDEPMFTPVKPDLETTVIIECPVAPENTDTTQK